ncbi:MAG: TonB-dependent receptor, partial [Cephaloticoccus sp.]|nr:TonB-dependent receptor [Cephaloticoccus sp.]
VEEEMRDVPFSNDLISESDYTIDDDGMELSSDLETIADPSPADRIAGGDRLNLRGFPTPALRNGFIQVGMPETLNTAQTIVIQGPLIPVLGRGAPGGIQNYLTARPKSKVQTRLGASFSNLDRQRVNLESTSPIIPKKLWQRIAVEWQRRGGPEEFAVEETQGISAAMTWRQSRSTSASLAVDLRQVMAQASPGIPNYRIDAAHLIAGPFLPLAAFNANGPDAGVRRRSAAASLQIETQPTKALALRASLEGWKRNVEQDRYTTPVLNLATGLFEGTREPRHLEQPQQAVALRLEGTYRFRALSGDHKLLGSASGTRGEYRREERALNKVARDALPFDVLNFDPYAPNYLLPPFSLGLYDRITADRTERADYTSVELSDRVAWRNGQTVLTAGMRLDEVSLTVEDHKPNSARPLIKDRTQQLSYQSGLNFQVLPRHLLAFASVNTAFDPSTPVDVRTGRIQNNETTLGYESGFRGRAAAGRLDYSLAGFLLYNRQISRRNPLYNDPIADANQTQPQLVAAGEERFSGGRMDLKWAATPTLQVSLKSSYTRALTTVSPDIPQEVGRPIARLPALKMNLALRHRPGGLTNGLTWGAGWQYLSNYVANYADSRRDYLAYPGYGIVQVSTGYQWRVGKRQLDLETGVRNLFDRDLLASNARVGTGREITFSARMIF